MQGFPAEALDARKKFRPVHIQPCRDNTDQKTKSSINNKQEAWRQSQVTQLQLRSSASVVSSASGQQRPHFTTSCLLTAKVCSCSVMQLRIDKTCHSQGVDQWPRYKQAVDMTSHDQQHFGRLPRRIPEHAADRTLQRLLSNVRSAADPDTGLLEGQRS